MIHLFSFRAEETTRKRAKEDKTKRWGGRRLCSVVFVGLPSVVGKKKAPVLVFVQQVVALLAKETRRFRRKRIIVCHEPVSRSIDNR